MPVGYGRVDVLGYSWGGALAQQLAGVHPAQIRRLVLVAPTTGALSVPPSPRVLGRLLAPRWPHRQVAARAVAAELFGATLRTHPERAADTLAAIGASLRGSRRGYAQQLAATVGWTSLPLLPAIRQQTLLVAGTDDPIVPVVNARIMNQLLPHSTIHLHSGGHIDLVTNATELAPVITTFLHDPGVSP